MIVIAGSVTVKPDQRSQAVRAAIEMQTKTRTEAGCLSYRFSSDLEDPNRFFIFEEWQSEEQLAAHFQSDHMRVFREKLPTLLAAGASTVKRYAVDSVAPM
jgi:quinol monooxygenase YgiN